MNSRPDLDRVFAHLEREPAIDIDPLKAMRAIVDDYAMGASGEGAKNCTVIPIEMGSIAAEWHVPPDCYSDRRVLHLHGGGWVAGSLASHRAFASELAFRSRQVVLLVDYRLAPENPFPAAIEDVSAAYEYVCLNGPNGASEALIAVSGDSAGGNLAAVLTARQIVRNNRVPDRLWLLSPFLAPGHGEQTVFGVTLRDPVVTADGMAHVSQAYASGRDLTCADIAPLAIDDEILARFPPTLLQVSAVETLRDQAFAFANRAWTQGSALRLSIWPDLPHVWQVYIGLLKEADAAIREAVSFLNGH